MHTQVQLCPMVCCFRQAFQNYKSKMWIQPNNSANNNGNIIFNTLKSRWYLAADSYYSKSLEGSKVWEGGARDLISINPFMKWRLLQTRTSYRN